MSRKKTLKINLIGLALLASTSGSLWAHGDEDHGAAPVAATTNSDKPQRLPDGRVLLPKTAQHRLEIRTLLASEGSAARAVELNGHVVMDPNRGGRVQASSGGRISAPQGGLPLLGSKVSQGQILAWVKPAASSYELAQQQAELAETRSKLKLAEQTAARLNELSNSVPRKEIQAAQAELDGLRARLAALAKASDGEALRAPVSGVLAASNAINGQVVDSSAVLFEIVEPKSMLIEALAYDPALVGNIASASFQGVSLRYLGGASALRDGALPLLFAPSEATPLALGQTVKLVVQTREQTKGIRIPASSLVKNSANESVVWLHDSALVFRVVPVTPIPVDGKTVLVTQLKPGSRVVTQGATLINQIR
ncbi:efflux RND transporter periplasmic adaptor subunit [Chitinibacter tainanensis]|uniref:efflux RND transporter periplasmic adaptor subunit n=1 Tax=Chitinibacter tainanensis TaxID=230667 RepID=UPI002354FAAD|nr:efflux RND transporter periplasmic adaptor subunit [Chitinibacter tainanensis]